MDRFGYLRGISGAIARGGGGLSAKATAVFASESGVKALCARLSRGPAANFKLILVLSVLDSPFLSELVHPLQ